jgi:energy-converting hydrogenase Eha subunit B
MYGMLLLMVIVVALRAMIVWLEFDSHIEAAFGLSCEEGVEGAVQ